MRVFLQRYTFVLALAGVIAGCSADTTAPDELLPGSYELEEFNGERVPLILDYYELFDGRWNKDMLHGGDLEVGCAGDWQMTLFFEYQESSTGSDQPTHTEAYQVDMQGDWERDGAVIRFYGERTVSYDSTETGVVRAEAEFGSDGELDIQVIDQATGERIYLLFDLIEETPRGELAGFGRLVRRRLPNVPDDPFGGVGV